MFSTSPMMRSPVPYTYTSAICDPLFLTENVRLPEGMAFCVMVHESSLALPPTVSGAAGVSDEDPHAPSRRASTSAPAAAAPARALRTAPAPDRPGLRPAS